MMKASFRLAPVLLLGIVFSQLTLHAAPDSLDLSYESVLLVDHLNGDCVRDTLIGVAALPRFQFLPDRIIWGVDDSLSCDSTAASVTYFRFPSWDSLSGSLSLFDYNRDSVTDILLFYHGRIDTGSNRRDTSLSVALFGHEDLGRLDTLDFNLSDTLQSLPFHALALIEPGRFTDSAVNNYNGYVSYAMPYLVLDLDDTASTPPPIVINNSADKAVGMGRMRAMLWPNPADKSATLHVWPLSAGTICRIELIGSDGRSLLREEIAIGDEEELHHLLDLSLISSGNYRLVLSSGTRILTEQSVVIVR